MLSEILSSPLTLIVVTVLGIAVCSKGIGRIAERGQWFHPLSIISCIMGAAILFAVGAVLFGIQLPLIDSPRPAVIALIVLVIVKVGLTQLHHAIA